MYMSHPASNPNTPHIMEPKYGYNGYAMPGMGHQNPHTIHAGNIPHHNQARTQPVRFPPSQQGQQMYMSHPASNPNTPHIMEPKYGYNGYAMPGMGHQNPHTIHAGNIPHHNQARTQPVRFPPSQQGQQMYMSHPALNQNTQRVPRNIPHPQMNNSRPVPARIHNSMPNMQMGNHMLKVQMGHNQNQHMMQQNPYHGGIPFGMQQHQNQENNFDMHGEFQNIRSDNSIQQKSDVSYKLQSKEDFPALGYLKENPNSMSQHYHQVQSQFNNQHNKNYMQYQNQQMQRQKQINNIYNPNQQKNQQNINSQSMPQLNKQKNISQTPPSGSQHNLNPNNNPVLSNSLPQQQQQAHFQPPANNNEKKNKLEDNLSLNKDIQSTPDNKEENLKYGLLGLLNVIRMTNKDLNTLALGTDLTTLGLNLNSPECLYNTFLSPFDDSPKRDPDFYLPRCYYIQAPMQPPHMKMNLFSEETLFYTFYSTPKDSLQLYAASELYDREWRFHTQIKRWFLKPKIGQDQNPNLPQQCIYFEPTTWEKVRKDNIKLQRNQFEDRPQINSQK
eukprot:TRINITY_DN16536_c0_g1_i1.p1 TRINITY_DN16536_c0_g1~~TRINITY_DN16536_c0_g1_i1.p1  ORF type:complete len:556 (+),score=149.41 TRINITY_DN16536_c0_g1_i1:2-1669(+)